MVAVAKRGPVSLSGPHFWIRVAKCFGQRRIQIWKLSQVWLQHTAVQQSSYADLVTIYGWWRDLDSIGARLF